MSGIVPPQSRGPLNNTNRIGDFVKWETRREYCRQQLTWTVPAGGVVIADPMGYPAIDNGDGTVTLALVATEANVNCALLVDTPIDAAAAAVMDVTVLRYGAAIVNENILPADDYADAAFTADAIKDALLAEGIQAVPEGPQLEEQTT